MLTGRTEITDRMLIFGQRYLRTILDEDAAHYNGRRPTAVASSIRGGPATPVAGLSQQRIRRRAVLSGLINEPQEPRSRPVAEF